MLAEAFATLAIVQPALHSVDFRRLLAWTTPVRPVSGSGLTLDQVRRVVWFVRMAARTTRARCLVTSLVLVRVLARRGVAADLRIGVQTDAGLLRAHAWVEWQGRALNDRPEHLQQYAAFDRPIGASRV